MMRISFPCVQNSYRVSIDNKLHNCPNLKPVACDTVSFSGNLQRDITKLADEDLIMLCRSALKIRDLIGSGIESCVYRIQDYPQYCIKTARKFVGKTPHYKVKRELNDYDIANSIVTHLNKDTVIMKYIEGTCIKKYLSGKEKLQQENILKNLLKYPEQSFISAIEQIEKAKTKGLYFDRLGENIIVNDNKKTITCFDFNYKEHSNYVENYNPISYLYKGLNADNSIYSKELFTKICKAYSKRLLTAPLEELNLNDLKMKFFKGEYIWDEFKNFSNKGALEKIEIKLKELINLKISGQDTKLKSGVNEFQSFIDDCLNTTYVQHN